MEHIKIRTPSFMLTPYLLLSILFVGFAAVIISMGALEQPIVPPTNPFSAYADIFPGQPESALEGREFSCFADDRSYDHDPSDTTCILHPESGVFLSLQVIISKGMIRQITFLTHENILTIGDLALILDTRDFHWTQRLASFSWRGKLGYAWLVGRRRSFFRRVWQVTFTDTPLP